MKDGPSTMTVAQLREELSRFDDDALVVFANDYGDRSHTMQVGGIETVTESGIRESAYSQSGFALPHEDEDDDEDEDTDDEDAGDEPDRPLYVVLQA